MSKMKSYNECQVVFLNIETKQQIERNQLDRIRADDPATRRHQEIALQSIELFLNKLDTESLHPVAALMQVLADIKNSPTDDMLFKNSEFPEDIGSIESIAERLMTTDLDECDIIPELFKELIFRKCQVVRLT